MGLNQTPYTLSQKNIYPCLLKITTSERATKSQHTTLFHDHSVSSDDHYLREGDEVTKAVV